MVQRGRWVGTTLRHGQLRQVGVRDVCVWVGGRGRGGMVCLPRVSFGIAIGNAYRDAGF